MTYYLYTKEKDYHGQYRMTELFVNIPIQIICMILIGIVMIIISFCVFKKNIRKKYIETWKDMNIAIHSIGKSNYNNSFGNYSFITNKICVNLEEIRRVYGLDEEKITNQFVCTSGHEDIHKCLRYRPANGQEFIIGKMGY